MLVPAGVPLGGNARLATGKACCGAAIALTSVAPLVVGVTVAPAGTAASSPRAAPATSVLAQIVRLIS